MNSGYPPYKAIVLAGERPGGSAFSQELGLPSSVLVDVAGKPAVTRVIESLSASLNVSGGLLIGPTKGTFLSNSQFSSTLSGTGFRRMAPSNGPSASVLAGLDEVGEYPVLVTAADHALLTPGMIDDFCGGASTRSEDVIVGLVPYELVKKAFPESRRTILKFSDGQYCGSNLFAIRNATGAAGPRFWQQVEADRKRPWRMVRRLGIFPLFRYLTGRLTLGDAMASISSAMGCQVGVELINNPRAAVDVDSVADLRLAEQILKTDT